MNADNRAKMTNETKNQEAVLQAVNEVWNQGNYANLNNLVADHVVIHTTGPGGDIHGHEGIRQFYSMMRAGFPDLHFTVEDQIAHGDKVVTRWSARGTHRGAFQGIPPTGKQVDITGMDIDRFVDSKVVECWALIDELGMMQQLGVVPMPGEGAH
jgi:steroid delta-isomerase-like uncharacterized protein